MYTCDIRSEKGINNYKHQSDIKSGSLWAFHSMVLVEIHKARILYFKTFFTFQQKEIIPNDEFGRIIEMHINFTVERGRNQSSSSIMSNIREILFVNLIEGTAIS